MTEQFKLNKYYMRAKRIRRSMMDDTRINNPDCHADPAALNTEEENQYFSTFSSVDFTGNILESDDDTATEIPASPVQEAPREVLFEDSFRVNIDKSDVVDNEGGAYIASKIREWSIHHNITHLALSDLLKILQPAIPSLASDARTLLKTCRNVGELKIVEPGQYYHFGLKDCIKKLFHRSAMFYKDCNSIEISVNIDGLPLGKSSNSQVYPILCSLTKNRKIVEIVGIYQGNEKPKEANLFLADFVNEAQVVVGSGLHINEKFFTVRIVSFISDVPAKSFITYTKGHAGYHSCSKCDVEGEYIEGRVCFPYTNRFNIRTDEEFRTKFQSSHHTGTSVLEHIPGIDMIKNFTLDYMHLICLGVVKKLLMLWCYGKPSTKISFKQVSDISDALVSQKRNIPVEFNRKPRSLIEVKRWKATEYRQLLFYTGPVVLKSFLSKERYLNFLVLHIACTLVSNGDYLEHTDNASTLFKYFIQSFQQLYGVEHVSHNVHNLSHIADDVKLYGILDNFSAFPYENFLQSILRDLRKGEKPLEQIIKRKSERDNMAGDVDVTTFYPCAKNEYADGPVLHFTGCKQFKKIILKDITLRICAPDNCCSLNNGNIVLIKNIILSENEYLIIGSKFLTLNNFFETPCLSSELGIFVAKTEFTALDFFSVKDVKSKCVKLDYKEQNIIIPLLHTSDSK